jgi:hypothetical protein
MTMEFNWGNTILELGTQYTLIINIPFSQVGIFVHHPMNLVVEAFVVMTLDPLVNLDTNIDIGETQVNLQRIITPTTTT